MIDILEKIPHPNPLPKGEGTIGKINKILDYLVSNKVSENLIFILTDSTDKVDEKLLKLVSNNNDVVIINIFDYFENNLSELL
jgi:hypothetical protein